MDELLVQFVAFQHVPGRGIHLADGDSVTHGRKPGQLSFQHGAIQVADAFGGRTGVHHAWVMPSLMLNRQGRAIIECNSFICLKTALARGMGMRQRGALTDGHDGVEGRLFASQELHLELQFSGDLQFPQPDADALHGPRVGFRIGQYAAANQRYRRLATPIARMFF